MTFPNRQENGEGVYMANLGCSALPLFHEEGCNDWLYILSHIPFSCDRWHTLWPRIFLREGQAEHFGLP